MDDKVVDFNRRGKEHTDPHAEGDAICMNCGYEYIAVAPVGITAFECPKCHTERATFVHPLFKNQPHCKCGCGNKFFTIAFDGSVCCAACGRTQRW